MATFDRNQPHGVIYGDPQGRVYEQDGAFFLGDGTQWVAPAEAADEQPAARVSKKKPASAEEPVSPVDAELAAQLSQQG